MEDLELGAVEAAYARLRDVVRRTPVLDWGVTGGTGWRPPVGQRLTLKLEHLQITGSF
jgi:threonine dehydratase